MNLFTLGQICLLFIFFPALFIKIKILVPVYLLIISIYLFLCLVKKNKSVINPIINLYKYTSYKYYILFLLWIVFSISILLLIGKINIINYLASIFCFFIPYYILYSVFPCVALYPRFNFIKIYKLLFFIFFLIFVYGIISYIGMIFDIKPILVIQNLISNRQFLGGFYNITHNTERVRSVFYEPGIYAYFININIPLYIYAYKTKFKLFKNKYWNFFIKKSLIFLAFINIILTKSPMGIVIFMLIMFVYNLKAIKRSLLNYKSLILIFLILVLSITFIIKFETEIKSTYQYKRIEKVTNSFKNLELLAVKEISLFSRIASYVNNFRLFLNNPILGVGLDQAKFTIVKTFESSPILLTKENLINIEEYYLTGKMNFNRNIFCDVLSETGIIGFCLLYFYFIRTIIVLNKYRKYYKGLNKELLILHKNILIIMILLSIYEISLVSSPYHFFMFIVANMFDLYHKRGKNV